MDNWKKYTIVGSVALIFFLIILAVLNQFGVGLTLAAGLIKGGRYLLVMTGLVLSCWLAVLLLKKDLRLSEKGDLVAVIILVGVIYGLVFLSDKLLPNNLLSSVLMP